MRRYLPIFALFLFAIGCDGKSPLSIPGVTEPQLVFVAGDGQAGPLRVYFTKPESAPGDKTTPAYKLVAYINQTRKTLDVCCYELDNQIITEALVNAVKRGVRVRLVTDTDNIEESGIVALQQVHVPVIEDHRGAIMHNKFIVFDNMSVWTGSMNFTENCAYKNNNNNGMYIDDARIAANYATKFAWMFEEHKFGGAPTRASRIPNPVVALRDGTPVENYFSTHDHVADHVQEKVAQAKRSIHFLAFDFTHEGIAQAMKSRAAAGVEVLGVFESRQAQSTYSQLQKLKAYGPPIQVYTDANPRTMHHKVIVIDGEVVVAGSFNFSSGADKDNDENIVIIHNPTIAAKFETEFQYVYGLAKRAEGAGAVSAARRR